MALLRHWRNWRKQRKSRQCGSKAECQRTGLQITEEFRREFESTLKPVRRLRFRGNIGQGRDGFTRQIYRGCGKTNRDKGDRSQDRFRVEMEICGDPVSARAFPQALTHPKRNIGKRLFDDAGYIAAYFLPAELLTPRKRIATRTRVRTSSHFWRKIRSKLLHRLAMMRLTINVRSREWNSLHMLPCFVTITKTLLYLST